jgi:hypothetical protein
MKTQDDWGAEARLFAGDELQAARKAAAERFEKIAMLYLPSDWTVQYRKSLSGRCYHGTKMIATPRPRTRKAPYIFLHECAHIHLHSGRRPKAHVREMEAEKWAHAKMREHGIPVPRKMTERAKQYVAHKIRTAINCGAKTIAPEAKRFAR